MTTQLTHRAALPANTDTQVDYILLDSSTSMSDKWYDSLSAIDAYVTGLRTNAVRSDVILHMFYSANVDYVHRTCDNASWAPLTQGAPGPSGQTPLYDAINAMGRRLRDLNPARASVVIVTDGEDNGSVTSVEQAKAILAWLRAKGWCVTFIGANFANWRMASLLGSDAANAIGVQRHLLTDAAKSLADKRARYARTGDDMGFTSDEQQQFGGYLAPPKATGGGSPWSQ